MWDERPEADSAIFLRMSGKVALAMIKRQLMDNCDQQLPTMGWRQDQYVHCRRSIRNHFDSPR